jgi:CPA2 family monovalent cation:H+ antiporter-2/glutathione-regulated potassium-efflux system ancillary protein KefC
MELLQGSFVYLLAMVVAVPLAKRLGLGSVLGYLLAGIVIGPALGIVGAESKDVKHFAEFGVVMMLFLIGLELQPSMLWRMRSRLLGLGGLQVLATTIVFFVILLAAGFVWQTGLAISMILALSSTAIVLQTLEEKHLMKTQGGESAFSVLLFQDIAVIPMLALLPLLAVGHGAGHGSADAHHGGGLGDLPGWAQGLAILAVMAAIVFAGRYLMRPVFRFIAEARLREIFSAAALLLVIGIALAMDWIGLSPALGTFLAGVVLSGSEYRHELESDIAPFKGLLLGVFFISVGAGIDFGLLASRPGMIVGLALALIAIKLVILLALGKLFGLRGAALWLFGLGLAQAGEFAFVLFSFAGGAGVIGGDVIQIATLVVAITMLLTPLGFILYERVIAPRAGGRVDREPDTIEEKGTAIIAGVGRFGQIVNRLLIANGHKTVVLDHDVDIIDLVRRFGIRSYYGDATRPDLLEAAGIDEAGVLVAALDDRDKQTELVEHVARAHPSCRIIARAVDRPHVYELLDAGAHHAERELFEASLNAGRLALQELGAHPFTAELQARSFRTYDKGTLEALHENWRDGGMDASYVDEAKERTRNLDQVMQSDRMAERHDSSDRGWLPPPKGDAVV